MGVGAVTGATVGVTDSGALAGGEKVKTGDLLACKDVMKGGDRARVSAVSWGGHPGQEPRLQI